MKTIAMFALACSLGFMSFNRPASALKINVPKKHTVAGASVQWAHQQINMGDVPQGKPVTFEFEFTNTGKEPVLITQVKAACGCTTPNYSTAPVKPGEKGLVKAVYNAAAAGAFTKNVTVNLSSDPNPVILTLSGTVVPAAN